MNATVETESCQANPFRHGGHVDRPGSRFPPFPLSPPPVVEPPLARTWLAGPQTGPGRLCAWLFRRARMGGPGGERGRFPVMDTSHSRPSGDRDTLCVRSQPRKRGQNKSPCEQDAFQQNTYVQRHKMINNLPHTRLTKVFWKYQFLEVCLF